MNLSKIKDSESLSIFSDSKSELNFWTNIAESVPFAWFTVFSNCDVNDQVYMCFAKYGRGQYAALTSPNPTTTITTSPNPATTTPSPITITSLSPSNVEK